MVGLDSSEECLREEKQRELKRAGAGFGKVRDGSKRHRRGESVGGNRGKRCVQWDGEGWRVSHGARKTVNETKTAKWMERKRRKKNQKTAKRSDEKKNPFYS